METFYIFRNLSGIKTHMQFTSIRLANEWLKDMEECNPRYANELKLFKVTITRVEEEIDV